jgi:TonB family protein
MTFRTCDISILLPGVLAAMCCGCLVPGQARVPKAQTVTIAGEHSFIHPIPKEPMVSVEYPARPMRDHIEGYVKLWLTIDPTGTVIAVNPATETPDRDFYEAAKSAALAQRWNPAQHDGRPVFTILQYTYHFRLDSR